ncbi:PAS domain S-box protein [Desulfobacula sp.]
MIPKRFLSVFSVLLLVTSFVFSQGAPAEESVNADQSSHDHTQMIMAVEKAASSGGWTIPLNYQSVHDCLKELKIGPYKDLGKITIQDFFQKYWILIVVIFAMLVALALCFFIIIMLTKKLKIANKKQEEGVAERIKAGEALQKSEGQLRSIIEHSKELFYIHDINHVLTYVSPTSEIILGYAPGEMQKKWTEFATDNPLNQMGFEMTQVAIKTGEKQKVHLLELKKKDGSLVLVEVDESPVKDATGKVVELTGALRDVTEQKQIQDRLIKSEQRFRGMFNAISDIVYTHDLEGCFTSVNPAMCEAFGNTEDELIGRVPSDFMKPEFVEAFKNEYLEPIKKQGHKEGMTIYFKKNGEKIYLEYRSVLVQPEYDIPFISGTGRDVTERVLSERKVDKLQTQLTQAQKMESVGRLAGGVAHDYNNALSAIMGFTELAMTRVDPKGKLHDDLNQVIKAADRAANITRQLLAFARKQTIAPKIIDLNKNVETMLKMLRRLIGEDLDLVWLPGADLWSVKIDPSQVDQILANLCVNARDAIEGVGRITIETGKRVLDKAYCQDHAGFVPGEYVLLTISDNGCGMDREILDNIFEPFFTTKDVDKGTGLGMAMVYGIVKQNNGFINVYSESDKGTAVKIYLPRQGGETKDFQQKITAKIPKGHGEMILLVEDDLPILTLTEKILVGLGYEVLPTVNPNLAINMAQKHAGKLHLLLTDVIMPEMNGRELAERLQSLFPGLKSIFMSGYTANVIAHQGVLDKGLHFIQKPFSKRDLANIVRKVLNE